jgi:hypothetical protein
VTGSAERSSKLQGLLDRGGSDLPSLQRLCEGSVEHLSASGAGVSVVTEAGVRDIVFATDDVSIAIEELQVSLGEGPCIDAWSGRHPVMEPDLSRTPVRWPIFGPAARAAGAAAVFALPLQIGAARVGALDIYRATPGGLSDADIDDAVRLGEAMTHVLLELRSASALPDLEDAEGGLAVSAEVYQAAGMLTVQLEVKISEALARLRAYAYAEERPLRDVARDVVARRLRLERD